MTLEEFEAIQEGDWCLVKLYHQGIQIVKYRFAIAGLRNRNLHSIITQNGEVTINEIHFKEHFGSFPELTFEEANIKFAEYLI